MRTLYSWLTARQNSLSSRLFVKFHQNLWRFLLGQNVWGISGEAKMLVTFLRELIRSTEKQNANLKVLAMTKHLRKHQRKPRVTIFLRGFSDILTYKLFIILSCIYLPYARSSYLSAYLYSTVMCSTYYLTLLAEDAGNWTWNICMCFATELWNDMETKVLGILVEIM